MKDLFALLVRPDFMQGMLLACCLFLIPLKRRQNWQRRLAAVLTLSLLTGAGLSMLVQQVGFTVLTTMLYYLSPLAAGWLLIYLCADLPVTDALYGVSCAYAAQHMAFCTIVVFGGEHVYPMPLRRTLAEWAVHLVVLGLCYLLFARRLPIQGRYQVSPSKAVVTAGIVLFIAMVLNRIVREVWQTADPTVYSICMAYDFFSCLFVLWLQAEQRREVSLLAAVETERRLRLQTQEQYELSRENIDLINRKCHDLKHQIAALRFVDGREEREASLREIENSVMIYDSVAKTGNEVLDTVLTEKSLLCERNGISWTCMADGHLLDFISPVDLYTLFGNALDNAIEGSLEVPDREQRNVAVTVQSRHGAAFIQVENYFAHPIQLEHGMPRTTKPDAENHGFGVSSIRSVAQRYGGTMDISAEDGIFLLSVLIPIPANN
ncbi:MAG: ATP-binding protein [Candidatus Onthomonas sp.]